MTDQQQLAAWITIFTPAFTALLVIALAGVVGVVVADYKDNDKEVS